MHSRTTSFTASFQNLWPRANVRNPGTYTDHVRTRHSYCGNLACSYEARFPNTTQRDRRGIRPAPCQTASYPAIPAPSSAVPRGKQKTLGIACMLMPRPSAMEAHKKRDMTERSVQRAIFSIVVEWATNPPSHGQRCPCYFSNASHRPIHEWPTRQYIETETVTAILESSVAPASSVQQSCTVRSMPIMKQSRRR